MYLSVSILMWVSIENTSLVKLYRKSKQNQIWLLLIVSVSKFKHEKYNTAYNVNNQTDIIIFKEHIKI